jgi:hypothetical protein
MVDGQTKLRLQLIALLKSYFPLVLELFATVRQQPLLLSVLSRWPDPRQLRRADPRLIRRVLREHRIRNEEQQDEIIDRIRSAQLRTRDDALIMPAAMAVRLLVSQLQQSHKTIKEFDVKVAEAMKRHPDAHLFTSLRGAGPTLAPRLLCAFGSQKDRWEDADSLAVDGFRDRFHGRACSARPSPWFRADGAGKLDRCSFAVYCDHKLPAPLLSCKRA